MANLFIQIIIFSLIKLSFQSNNETFVDSITSNNNLNAAEDKYYLFQKCEYIDDENFILFLICLLNVTKTEPYLFKYFFENEEMRNTVLSLAHIYLEKKECSFYILL